MVQRYRQWAAASLVAALAPASVHAAETHRFAIAAGRLDQAILELGRQGGVSVALADPAMGEIRVRRVAGTMDAETALARLLRGTGLGVTIIDARSFRIVRVPVRARPAPPPRRPAPRPAAPRRADPAPPEEIIVTASKRDTALADYPAAVTVMRLDDSFAGAPGQHGSDVIVRQLPSVNSTNLGPGRNKLFIRGVADSSFTGPTQATVGQYFGYARLNYNAPDPDIALYDIDKIEVLEGPQGTLYGAGSLGGIIRIDPARPDSGGFAARMQAGYALTQHGADSHDAAATLNLPLLTDRAALRVVGYHRIDGGYIDDSARGLSDVNRSRIFGGRAALRVTPGDGWTIDAGWVRQDIQTRDGQYSEAGLPDLTRQSLIAQPFDNDYSLLYATVEKSWGPLVLRSTGAIVSHDLANRFDASALGGGSPLAFTQDIAIRQHANETTLSRQGAHGHGWIAGISITDGKDRTRRALGDPAAPVPIADILNERSEVALFGEWTFGLAPRLSASLGGRYAHTRFSGELIDPANPNPPEPRRAVDYFVPAVALRWKPGGGWLIYGRYQEGFRPGGLSVSSPGSAVAFQSDTIATFELGARRGSPDHDPLSVALSGSYARWESIQADLVDAQGFPYTDNIGNGSILGFSASATWNATASLRLDGSAFLNHSSLTQAAPAYARAEDNDLPNIAQWGARVGARWVRSVGADARLSIAADARYVGKSYLGVGNLLDISQGRYVDTALNLRLERGRFGFALGVTNLFNADRNRFSYGNPFTVVAGRQETPLRPRTVRIGLDAAF